jgi:hypothetical protein
MKFLTWFAGFFEDQGGSASSKRGTLYICLFFLWRIIEASLNGKDLANPDVLYFVVGIILFCLGAVTAEFFKSKLPDVTKTTTTETASTEVKTS